MQSMASSHHHCGMIPKKNDEDAEDILAKTPTAKRARLSSSSSNNPLQEEHPRTPGNLVTPQVRSNNAAGVAPEIRSLLMKEAGFDTDAQRSNTWNKRQGYLCWEDFFFGVCQLSSRRSKNPVAPYGACIVDAENRVVGIGYDGLPRDCPDDCIPYQVAEPGSKTPFLHTQNPYICPAEVNAILNKCSADVAGCRMYVERFPSNECAKVIVQSRIKEVIYLKDEEPDKDAFRASRILFGMAGVKTTQYVPTVPLIGLEFVSALAPTTKDAFVETVNDGRTTETNAVAAAKTSSQERYRELMIREAGYDPTTKPSSHRTDNIGWDDYFMAMAFLTAKRSKDPNTQVGAVIVHAESKRILAMGYNGFPRGCSDDCLPWARKGDSELQKKYLYVCHAEVNAVLNKGSADVKGATLYVALFPCSECSKVIIQAGIREVVYMSDQYHDTDACRASRILFQMAGVHLRKHIPSFQTLQLRLKPEEKSEVEAASEYNTK